MMEVQDCTREGESGGAVVAMSVPPDGSSGVDTLYRRYRTQARRTASMYYPFDSAAVEDVVQDVFVSLCETIDRIDTSKSMASWIGRVTSNRCRDRRRRAFATKEVLRASALRRGTSELEDRIEVRDDLCHILSALDRLPARQAYAFRKYYLQGVGQKTIAEQLGVTNGYVSKMLKMARSTLREEIAGGRRGLAAEPSTSTSTSVVMRQRRESR